MGIFGFVHEEALNIFQKQKKLIKVNKFDTLKSFYVKQVPGAAVHVMSTMFLNTFNNNCVTTIVIQKAVLFSSLMYSFINSTKLANNISILKNATHSADPYRIKSVWCIWEHNVTYCNLY